MDTTKTLFDTSSFWTINWYYIVALVVSITGIIIAYKNYRKKPAVDTEKIEISNNSNSNNITSTSNPSITITNNINTPKEKDENNSINITSINEEKLKATTKILFIDDHHTEYKMVSILKKAGWTKTKSVKDISDLDSQNVVDSDIIFVDINGVGLALLFEDQGLGLASALKIKYPKKKIIIYSAVPDGDRFHKALRQVDDCLPKNAEPYQFINLVENLSKSL
jgi:mRNA-degrading endonuclease HigB of HigAB toxin-antitoxin module